MEFGVEKYSYEIIYKNVYHTHVIMDISHDKYLIFVLFEIVVSRVMVKLFSTPVMYTYVSMDGDNKLYFDYSCTSLYRTVQLCGNVR